MARGLLRPTFEATAPQGPDDVGARLTQALAQRQGAFESRWARGQRHVIIAPAPGRRRIWSAWLHLDLRAPHKGEGTSVFGRFTPSPTLWTAYMLALIALLAIALFALALTLAQMTLERPVWGFWVLAGSVAFACALVYASMWAQRRAMSEMDEMRALVEHAVGVTPSQA